ncbi:MAG: hypothetical protein ABI175_19480 [Polyangiales bacterium]
MAAISSPGISRPVDRIVDRNRDVIMVAVDGHAPARQAYRMLHFGFVLLPLIAGADKFFDKLTNWDAYLAPVVANYSATIGGRHHFMMGVGVVEIVAAFLVAAKPKLGAYVVAAWLLGIIGNLVLLHGAGDIILRDVGLMIGALALGRLAQLYDRPRRLATTTTDTYVADPAA